MWSADRVLGTTPALAGRLYRRLDTTSAVLIYTGSSFQKRPLGYYYSTRISWQLYEVVGEIPEGLVSCILAPEEHAGDRRNALTGRVRLARQAVGQIRLSPTDPFLTFKPIGSQTFWTTECNDENELTLRDSGLGELMRIRMKTESDCAIAIPRRQSSFDRIGSFIRPLQSGTGEPELRAGLLVALAAMLDQTRFDVPWRRTEECC